MIILGVLLLFSLSTARGAEDGSEDNEANIIGATALHHHLTLLTNNRRHFELIDGLPLMSL
jgi:predicted nucleic acid-binding protein